ncbi:MAG: ferrochelatase, partial [Chloroflexota bacterium]
TKQSPNRDLEIASQKPLAMTPVAFDFVESWHTQPRYIEAIARNVQTALAQLPSDAQVLFTAHTLPVSAREPYEAQLRATAQLIAAKLGLRADRWMLCYQSKPRAPGDWLEPQIEQLVPELARAGTTNLVIAPIGFVADHLEVLYDLDIALQEIARANSVRVVRSPMLNDDDALVNALAELVRSRITHHESRDP